MAALYVDNFRGFDNAFLPLDDVNFFVGENSSGKTSILKIIKILSSANFWFDLELNSDLTELGYYSEIVNQNEKKKYFEIGIIESFNQKKKSYSDITASVVRFVNKKDQPVAKEVWFLREGISIQTTLTSGNIKYKYHNVNDIQTENKTELEFLQDWVNHERINKKNYSTISKERYTRLEVSLYFQLQIIIEDLQRDKKNRRSSYLSIPRFASDITWLAPIRTEPRRTYDSYRTKFNPTGSHTPYLLKAMLSKSNNNKSKTTAENIQILNKFGRDSGLFDAVEIKNLGNSDTSPFEVRILLNNRPLKITNVGYGVSQILPVIIEVILSAKNTWFAIQQPEIHLHPRGQAAFGDFIFDNFNKENKKFVIETHSDFIIDRFRIRLSKKKEEHNKSSQIVFFMRNDRGNQFSCIPINKDGSLPDEQPSEFRDFFIKEELELIQI